MARGKRRYFLLPQTVVISQNGGSSRRYNRYIAAVAPTTSGKNRKPSRRESQKELNTIYTHERFSYLSVKAGKLSAGSSEYLCVFLFVEMTTASGCVFVAAPIANYRTNTQMPPTAKPKTSSRTHFPAGKYIIKYYYTINTCNSL